LPAQLNCHLDRRERSYNLFTKISPFSRNDKKGSKLHAGELRYSMIVEKIPPTPFIKGGEKERIEEFYFINLRVPLASPAPSKLGSIFNARLSSFFARSRFPFL